MVKIYKVFGVEIRVTDVMPQEVIGVNNGHYLVLFWQGAEIGRIYPAPNTGLQSDGAELACKNCGCSTGEDFNDCQWCRTPRR